LKKIDEINGLSDDLKGGLTFSLPFVYIKRTLVF